eukprot:TRINITY_DN2084_c0_g1_i2.p1 TRINITY_DN2084_c0_g1~~TRINITY_DN2084_c0_g1_i2.p1  ORF type:complete len:222 (-),score=16.38 TRINITY_DN2084_c0_g1_i2:20-685(-)
MGLCVERVNGNCSWVDECIYGSICLNGECIKWRSLNEGSKCTIEFPVCGDGLYCEGNSLTCKKSPRTDIGCQSSEDCNIEFEGKLDTEYTCLCVNGTGNQCCYPKNWTYYDRVCDKTIASLFNCMQMSNCPITEDIISNLGYLSEGSCAATHCEHQLLEATACNCYSDLIMGDYCVFHGDCKMPVSPFIIGLSGFGGLLCILFIILAISREYMNSSTEERY